MYFITPSFAFFADTHIACLRRRSGRPPPERPPPERPGQAPLAQGGTTPLQPPGPAAVRSPGPARAPGAEALLPGEAGGVIAARLLNTLAACRGAQLVVLHRGEELVLN